jgi:hypothetical protein
MARRLSALLVVISTAIACASPGVDRAVLAGHSMGTPVVEFLDKNKLLGG